MPNDVTFQHPDYVESLPQWTLVEDAAAGERAVKAKKETYLPKPNKKDASIENQIRYDQYVFRAVYYNATGRTLSALSGMAFTKWPEQQIPAQLEPWKEDVSGSGIPLVQHAQLSIGEVLKTGRAGILVDYPNTGGEVSLAAQSAGGVQPTMSIYPAHAITNWDVERRGGKVILTLVVLRESHASRDGFELKQEPQYRVLRLDATGYVVEIWRKRLNPETKKEEWYLFQVSMPTRGNSQRWQEIPFQFIGAKSNDWSIDPGPLYDIAVLNVAHYRNSADYEDSCYMVGQPQVWMSGLDEQWVKMLQEKGITFGSRTILPLPVNGSAGILQPQPNAMCKEAMDAKELQMAALGARLLVHGKAGAAAKTATEIQSDDTSSHSVLSLVCDNVSMAYTQAIKWAADFANAAGDVAFSIPTEFAHMKLDAQTMTAMMSAVQAGQMPLSDFWTQLREAGYIDSEKTDEQIREEIDGQSPPQAAAALTGAANNDPMANQGAQA